MTTPTFTDWPWRHWQHQQADKIALHLEHDSLTWRQLCQQIDQLVHKISSALPVYNQQLTENWLQKTVALRGKNSLQLLLTMLALWQMGARVLPLNPQLPQTLLQQLQDKLPIDYGIDFSGEHRIASVPLYNLLQEACYQSSLPASGRLLNDQQADCQQQGLQWGAQQSLPSPASPRLSPPYSPPYLPPYSPLQPAAWQPDRLLTLILTSGSTGLPKAAAHSAAAHLASARGVLALLPFTGSDCWLLSLPLYHVSGQGIIWRWLLAGGQLALRPAQPLIQALAGCSHASLVPTQLWRLLQHDGLAYHARTAHFSPISPCTRPSVTTSATTTKLATNSALPHLQAVLLGGASIATELVNMAQQRGIACWCGYGLTEFASTVCGKRADGRDDVGQVLNSCQIRVVDQEIWLRGDSLAAGYWHGNSLQPLLNPQGWFATHDRGSITAGVVSIDGRLDNQFFSGGEGIQPEHIERILARHSAVQQIFIVPLADREYGHIPVAVVDSTANNLQQLAAWAKPQLTAYQQPRHWLILPAEMRNGGIKISRHLLRQWVAMRLTSET